MDSILQKISKDLHPEQSVLPDTEVLGSAVALLQANEIDGLLVMIEAGKQLLFMRLENGKGNIESMQRTTSRNGRSIGRTYSGDRFIGSPKLEKWKERESHK